MDLKTLIDSGMIHARWLLLLLAAGCWAEVPDTDPRALELLERIDTLYQQDSARAVMTMSIVTPEFERSLSLESWSLGLDYALVRVLEPQRERGVSTLQRDNDMWNYLPKIRKVVKVPPSMMMGSWMGSDFTNDDLMRDVSLVEEYQVRLSETDTEYQLDLTPREQTVTVWGALEIIIGKDNLLPIRQRYYDEDGSLMRIMEFSDITDYGDVTLPATMTLTPMNKTGHQTTVTYQELDFGVDLTEDFFTLNNLRRPF
ncbi:outer membrane lipoprotein-sorting protein [Saccharospirillum impatiens]|uniref:outer membrane lipoprotein-sorting protein n=1 Tax=Saccharospirillum impatiens TaxID=169438 RepID=UPI0003FF7AB9|nr:outer membrane lipoprotein-sorting protein [Saccharospirillum impatiens]